MASGRRDFKAVVGRCSSSVVMSAPVAALVVRLGRQSNAPPSHSFQKCFLQHLLSMLLQNHRPRVSHDRSMNTLHTFAQRESGTNKSLCALLPTCTERVNRFSRFACVVEDSPTPA